MVLARGRSSPSVALPLPLPFPFPTAFHHSTLPGLPSSTCPSPDPPKPSTAPIRRRLPPFPGAPVPPLSPLAIHPFYRRHPGPGCGRPVPPPPWPPRTTELASSRALGSPCCVLQSVAPVILSLGESQRERGDGTSEERERAHWTHPSLPAPVPRPALLLLTGRQADRPCSLLLSCAAPVAAVSRCTSRRWRETWSRLCAPEGRPHTSSSRGPSTTPCS